MQRCVVGFALVLGTVAALTISFGCGGGDNGGGNNSGGNNGGGNGGGGSLTFSRALLNGSFAESLAVSGGSGQAVGAVRPNGSANGTTQAVTWRLSDSAPTILHPASASYSVATGVSDSAFVGWSIEPAGERALIWDRTAGNAITTLNGANVNYRAHGISGSLIVGEGRTAGGALHAYTWNHAAGNAPADLNGSFASSVAYGVSGTRVVGIGTVGGSDHAIVWETASGNAVTDLNPSGSASSQARGVSTTIVVGSIVVGSQSHAAFWNLASGNALTDLNPTGASASRAYATNGRLVVGQVGVAADGLLEKFGAGIVSSSQHAYVWDRDNGNQGTDLQTTYLADQGFTWSVAQGVDASGNVYGVGGAVVDDFNANYRAWTLIKQ